MSIIESNRKAVKDLEELRYNCNRNHWMAPCGPSPDFTPTGLFRTARYINHWRCEKCGTRRNDAVTANGGLITRRYEYPDGYLYGKEEERPTSDELRLWMVKRNKALGISAPASKAKTKLSVSQQLRAAADG